MNKKNVERNIKGLLFVFLIFLITLNFVKSCKSQPVRTTVSAPTADDPQKMKSFSFVYKFKSEIFTQQVKSTSQELAFKESARKCFDHFTKGKYPGEETGLSIIDSCANPVKETK